MGKFLHFGFYVDKGRLAYIFLAFLMAFNASERPANAQEYADLTTRDVPVATGFDDGARAMLCENVGFLAFTWAIDQELKSPQFPNADVQFANGLITITSNQVVNGISVPQSAFLWSNKPRTWEYRGFNGLEPVTDTCTDITMEIAASFVDLAMAASWGMPKVEQRVALFDALEDDLRTRLMLSENERDEAQKELVSLKDDFQNLETELALARMAACEIANQTQEVLVKASVNEVTDGLKKLSRDVAKAFGGEACSEEIGDIDNAVFVRSDNAPAKSAD